MQRRYITQLILDQKGVLINQLPSSSSSSSSSPISTKDDTESLDRLYAEELSEQLLSSKPSQVRG
jgi:uncharacterized protein YifN (PemK superfamily)